MSIFGALQTAVTGLSAQARSMGHISDNIANSQTVGFKRVETDFQTLVLKSDLVTHEPGGVRASPQFTNNVQGSLRQADVPTNIALSGQGFFQVSEIQTNTTGTTVLSTDLYTRAGDFELNRDRYLVNAGGFALNGRPVDPATGEVGPSVEPIVVPADSLAPVPTSEVDLALNLPATPAPGENRPSTSFQVFDAQGVARTITLDFRQQAAGEWRMAIDAPGSSINPTNGFFQGETPSADAIPQAVTAQTPVAQEDRISLIGTNPKVGDTYSVTLNNREFSFAVTENNIASIQTLDGVAQNLANEINSAVPPTGVLARASGAIVSLVAQTAGDGFSMTSSVTNAAATVNTIQGPTATQAASTATAQISSYTFTGPGIDIGDVYSVTVDGITIDVTVTASNVASFSNISGVTQEIANQINANPTLNAFPNGVIATASGGQLVLTARENNNTFTTSATPPTNGVSVNGASFFTETANVEGRFQQDTVTISGPLGDVGQIYTINVGGTPISYTTTGDEESIGEIAAQLASQINSNTGLPYTASSSGGLITLTAKNFDPPPPPPTSASALAGQTPAHILLQFGTDTENAGTLTGMNGALIGVGGSAVVPAAQSDGDPAQLTFLVNYGSGPQEITVDVGAFGEPGGITQFAGERINVNRVSQNGAPLGTFQDVEIRANGDVVVNYDNGREQVFWRVPIATFNNVNALQSESGNVYRETTDSGAVNFQNPNTNGAGAIIPASLENSNVDIADEFTKLIVTQRAYSANSRIVTTSDELLQETINMKR